MNNYFNNQAGFVSPFMVENAMMLQSYVAKVMRRIYAKMFLGLIVTALVSLFVASSPALIEAIFSSRIVFFGLIIAELGVVIALSAAINKMSSSTATLLFYLYAVLNGVTLSVIFFAYSMHAIALAFSVTAATFGVMSAYGYLTKADLSKMGAILFMGLIGVIIASLVNLFLASSTLDWVISIAGVVIFTGLTAWDTQRFKEMAAMTDPSMSGKVATMGALTLYRDFINLFLYLLRIFGRRS